MRILLCALLLGVAPPAFAQTTPQAATTEIDAQRLTLAKATVESIWPSGTYSRMINQMMSGVMEQMMGSVMNMSEADMAKSLGVEAKAKDKAASKETMLEKIRKEDPHFDERMRLTNKVMGEEMGRMGAILEPRLREGLAKAVAKRFTATQLTDVNRFLATESGRAFGGEMMMLWVDPDVFKAMLGSFPELMKEMPAAMQRVEKATAHLPKPKKKEPEKKASDADQDGED